MIPDRIKFTKEFDFYGKSEWLGIEGSIEHGETAEQALLQAIDIVNKTFNKTKPSYVTDAIKAYQPLPDINIDKTTQGQRDDFIKQIRAEIYAATSYDELQKNKIYIKPYPEIQIDYNIKHKQFLLDIIN